jgi:hypothetical protein
LCSSIVEHDPEYIKKADVLVVLANGPRYGTAIEIVAKDSGKKVILLAKDPVPTP